MGGLTVDIINYINESSSSGMLLGIYMAVLVYFSFAYCDAEKTFVRGIVYPGIVMFIGIFFAIPVVDKFVKDITAPDTFPRFVWILTPTMVLAFAFTFLIKKIDGNAKKMLAGIAICIMVFCAGEHTITSYIYQRPENLYKFPQSVVDISEKITFEMDEPRICVPVSSSYPFRQISTNIKLLYGEDAGYGRITWVDGILREVANQMETSQPDLYFITDVCKQNQVDYIVLDQTYMVFGETDLNDEGYKSNHVHIGDRTPIETESDGIDHSKELNSVSVVTKDGEDYWDLSVVGLEYAGTYGQYLLYRINEL